MVDCVICYAPKSCATLREGPNNLLYCELCYEEAFGPQGGEAPLYKVHETEGRGSWPTSECLDI